MEDSIYGGVLAVPLIVGLVEVAKRAGLGTAWSAPLAIGMGLTLRLGYLAASGLGAPIAWADAVVQGLALGLAASGLYSGVKRLGEGERRSDGVGARRDGDLMPRALARGTSPDRRAPNSFGAGAFIPTRSAEERERAE